MAATGHDVYVDGVLRARWNDETRIYTEWDAQGQQVDQRPYTAEENDNADNRAAQEVVESNERTVEEQVAAARATNNQIIASADAYLAIQSPTNAQVVAQVRDLTQAAKIAAQQRNRLSRIALRDYSGTD